MIPPSIAVVSAVALILYQVLAFNVGRARVRYQVKPPQVSGPPEFERVYRVQQNTLEQLVFFLPSLWLFAGFVNVTAAASFGGIWIFGRILYAWGYYQAPEKRGPGFGISFLAAAVLAIGALIGSLLALIQPAA
ncbi:MAPEG family protein [Synechococcus elongatus]|uniref:MAPEG family protein n=1 Tax=Synechococcus elongatus PCC 11801 TaxID=2219813 RepID=A0AAN1QKT0_SYNEL|nr:MAPEG family protein [Synechococcus elongatus]